MPGRVPGQCPSVSLPVTLLLPTWLLRRAGRLLAGLCPSTAACSPPSCAAVLGASPASWVARGTGTARGQGLVARELLSPVRQGLLCCKTLPRRRSRTLGRVSLQGWAWCPCPHCPNYRLQAGTVGTGTLCPTLHSGPLPVLCQHHASVSLHPSGSFPPSTTPSMRGEVSGCHHCHPSPAALRVPQQQRLRLEKPSGVRKAGLPSRKKRQGRDAPRRPPVTPSCPARSSWQAPKLLGAGTVMVPSWNRHHFQHPALMPALPASPTEGGMARCRWPGSLPARGCRRRRCEQVLAPLLFDPFPAAGGSTPRDRCVGQMSPSSSGSGEHQQLCQQRPSPSAVCGRRQLLSTSTELPGLPRQRPTVPAPPAPAGQPARAVSVPSDG